MSDCGVCEASTDGFICRHCVGEIEQAIGDMPALLGELENVVTRQTRVYRSTGPARTVEEQQDPEQHLPAMLRSKDGRVALRAFVMPVNLDASELAWVALNTLGAWARHLVESRGADSPDDGSLIAWLLSHVESFRWDEAGAEAHDEITHLHREVERAVDRSPSRLYAGPCHAEYEDVVTEERDGTIWTQTRTVRCERDLYAWPGATEVQCDGHRADGEGCGATYTLDERRDWLVEEVRQRNWELRELWEASWGLLRVYVPWETVRRWPRPQKHTQPRLQPVNPGAEVLLYRGSDVISLLIASAERAERQAS